MKAKIYAVWVGLDYFLIKAVSKKQLNEQFLNNYKIAGYECDDIDELGYAEKLTDLNINIDLTE